MNKFFLWISAIGGVITVTLLIAMVYLQQVQINNLGNKLFCVEQTVMHGGANGVRWHSDFDLEEFAKRCVKADINK